MRKTLKPLPFASATVPPQGTTRAWWNWTWTLKSLWTILKRLGIQGRPTKVKKIFNWEFQQSSNSDQNKWSLAIWEDLGTNTTAVSNSSAPLRVFYFQVQTHQLLISVYNRYFWGAVSLPVEPLMKKESSSPPLLSRLCVLSQVPGTQLLHDQAEPPLLAALAESWQWRRVKQLMDEVPF